MFVSKAQVSKFNSFALLFNQNYHPQKHAILNININLFKSITKKISNLNRKSIT